MMDVKSKIASFEAHNEEERTRRSSPKSKSPDGGISPDSSPGRQFSPSSTPVNDVSASPERKPSTTILASQNRIDRLKRTTNFANAAKKETRTSRAAAKIRAPQPRESPVEEQRRLHLSQQDTGSLSRPTAAAWRHRAAASRAIFGNSQSTARKNEPQHIVHQPELVATEEDSDPDGPLVPRTNKLAATTTTGMASSSPFRISRLNKLQKLQRRKQFERRSYLSLSQPADEQSSQLSTDPPDPPSGLHDEEDIGLTSVRQVTANTPVNHPNMTMSSSTQSPQAFEQPSASTPTRLWMRDDDNEKSNQAAAQTLVMAPSSSSDYETDADQSRGNLSYGEHVFQDPTRSGLSASAMTPDVAAFFEQQQTRHHHHQQQHQSLGPRVDDDETYDYGDRGHDDDDDSRGSLSYEQRRRKEEKQARQAAVAAAKTEMDNPFMQKEDMEHYRKTLDTPVAKTALVVATAATVGCVVLGPVGLLVGAAAVGLTVGAMQIPEEQRNNMVKSAQDSVMQAGDAISSTCVNTYQDSGIAEHVPVDVQNCCTGLEANDKDTLTVITVPAKEGTHPDGEGFRDNERFGPKGVESRAPPTPNRNTRVGNKKGKVACLREGHIVPVAQIHSLNPADQPRAWLDVLASASTTHDEKIEAMEEILILAKDKQRARIFVDEGILDSIMWILGRYFEKTKQQTESVDWVNRTISREEEAAAKLAANCCLTLGKTYCAAIHTEGDLLLMSLYEHGTVPEERQLAQMLHEVPHHVRITKTDDPTIVDPGKEVFALRQMTLPQAEELAAAIKNLAEAR